MTKFISLITAVLLFTSLARTTLAATILLDLNGFPNVTGGQISGAGLAQSIPLPPGKQRIELSNLTGGSTYSVDFFHNTGDNSSDFSFTVSKDGSGVESIAHPGKKFRMVKDFKPGTTTLTLNTHAITYNANGAQTGVYYIHGLLDNGAIKADAGPVKLIAAPGLYRVDNLYNSGMGNEDFSFIVDSSGHVSAGPEGGEYAEFSGSSISPRAVNVHFKITSTTPLSYHAMQAVHAATSAGNVYDLDMMITVGSSGLNIWSFGHSEVLRSNLVAPNGKPLQGATATNDFTFFPRLRYDRKKGFFFQTTEGPADSAHAEVTGTADDGKTKLAAIVSATIGNAAGAKRKPAE